MRLAPTRLVPFSYFWICWNVRPSASPSFSWLIPSMMRRMRTRLPTYLSTGLGALVAIVETPWDFYVSATKQIEASLPRCAGGYFALLDQNANCSVGLSTGGLTCRSFWPHPKPRAGFIVWRIARQSDVQQRAPALRR